MSVEALTWAFAQDVRSSPQKLVLVALANRAGDDGITTAGQAAIARSCSMSERQVRQHTAALEDAGQIARSTRRRPDGSRSTDYTVLGPGLRSWAPGHMHPPEPREYGGAVVELATGGNPPLDQPAETRRTRSGPLGPSLEPSEQTASARAFELNGTMPVDVTEAERRVLAAVERIGRAKRAKPGKAAAVVELCRRFADRDLAGEAERFEHYYTDGRGENVKVRDVVARWRNWIDQAPGKQTGRRSAKGTARQARHDRRRAMVEQAGLLQPEGTG